MDKNEALCQLAKKRQHARWNGYNNIGDYHDGAYDCDFVSPYTKSACNLDAEVMIILQDWRSHEKFSDEIDINARDLGHTPSLSTNKKLKCLLFEHFGLQLHQTYATNLFPFIKMGSMSSNIPQVDLVRAAKEYALPQIEIVQPSVVICLGIKTFNAIRSVCGLRRTKNLTAGIAAPFTYDASQIWCQAHTSVLGQNNRNRGGVNRVQKDWDQMTEAIAGSRGK